MQFAVLLMNGHPTPFPHPKAFAQSLQDLKAEDCPLKVRSLINETDCSAEGFGNIIVTEHEAGDTVATVTFTEGAHAHGAWAKRRRNAKVDFKRDGTAVFIVSD